MTARTFSEKISQSANHSVGSISYISSSSSSSNANQKCPTDSEAASMHKAKNWY